MHVYYVMCDGEVIECMFIMSCVMERVLSACINIQVLGYQHSKY